MNASIRATAPDQVTPASTIELGVFVDHFNLDVVNQAILWAPKVTDQPGQSPGAGAWGVETQMLPGSRTIKRRNLSGVRFRAFTPLAQLPAGSTQAYVILEAVT